MSNFEYKTYKWNFNYNNKIIFHSKLTGLKLAYTTINALHNFITSDLSRKDNAWNILPPESIKSIKFNLKLCRWTKCQTWTKTYSVVNGILPKTWYKVPSSSYDKIIAAKIGSQWENLNIKYSLKKDNYLEYDAFLPWMYGWTISASKDEFNKVTTVFMPITDGISIFWSNEQGHLDKLGTVYVVLWIYQSLGDNGRDYVKKIIVKKVPIQKWTFPYNGTTYKYRFKPNTIIK